MKYFRHHSVAAARKLANHRISRPELFYKKGVLNNFTKFTGKHLYQSLFSYQASGLQLYLKKRLWHGCFPVNFCQISKHTVLHRTPLVAASVTNSFFSAIRLIPHYCMHELNVQIEFDWKQRSIKKICLNFSL